MLSKIKMSVLSMSLFLGLIGCASNIVLYPITDRDICVIEKGKPSPIDGYGMSEFYLNEVMQVKLSKK